MGSEISEVERVVLHLKYVLMLLVFVPILNN